MVMIPLEDRPRGMLHETCRGYCASCQHDPRSRRCYFSSMQGTVAILALNTVQTLSYNTELHSIIS